MRLPLVTLLASTAAIAFVAGCTKPESGTGPAPSATATTSAAHTATASATAPASSAAPAASSAAPASSDAAPVGNVHLKIESVKVVSGKVDRADKKVKSHAMKMRRKCLDPELKKDPASTDGSAVITLELDTEGKAKKATHKIEGKFPEDALKCMEKLFEKDIEFDTENTKAKVDIKIVAGPNVTPDK